MANKPKVGLGYYPMEVNFFNDIKVRKLIKRKGGEAVSVYVDLLCKIYKNGYFVKWDDDLPFTISEDIKQDETFIKDVIKVCLEVGLLSEIMFQKNQVLTSKGIQDRYVLICKQLKRSAILSEFMVNSSEEMGINSEEMPNSSEEIGNSSEEIPQRKGKEKKEKENKANKIKVKDNIFLTLEQIEKLKTDYGEENYQAYIDHLSDYKIEKGYKTKDDYLTITRWVIDAVTEKQKRRSYDTKNSNVKKSTGFTFKPGGAGTF